MLKSDQIHFLLQLNLRNLRKTEAGYNFSCPVCGDSKKSQSKRRCWALTRKDPKDLIIYCHNCGYSSHFKWFLQKVNSRLFNEYSNKEKEEYFRDLTEGKIHKKISNSFDINIDTPIKYKFKLNPKYFKPARDFKKAVDFCKKRQILDHINELYYCIHPSIACSGMLIFPCYMEDNKTLYAFVGRHTEYKKFHIHSKNESFKVFNFFHVDLNEDVFIFESIIDSYTLDNSIAALGADISENILKKIKKPIMIFDNDKTGRIKTLKYLRDKKERCFIPPDDFHFKDFNAAYCAGWSKDRLRRLVKENTYEGFIGIMKINFKMIGKQ